MITTSDDVDAGFENFARGGRSNSGTTRRVFAIGHDEIQAKSLAESWQEIPHRLAARFANNIAYKEQLHRGEPTQSRIDGRCLT